MTSLIRPVISITSILIEQIGLVKLKSHGLNNSNALAYIEQVGIAIAAAMSARTSWPINQPGISGLDSHFQLF